MRQIAAWQKKTIPFKTITGNGIVAGARGRVPLRGQLVSNQAVDLFRDADGPAPLSFIEHSAFLEDLALKEGVVLLGSQPIELLRRVDRVIYAYRLAARQSHLFEAGREPLRRILDDHQVDVAPLADLAVGHRPRKENSVPSVSRMVRNPPCFKSEP
jgi:hypothetical protein